MRGKILGITRTEAVNRALSQIIAVPVPPAGAPGDAGGRPIEYRLEGGFNGGSDPTAPHCASWSYGDRTPTADCIGFVLWASGVDRMQPGYKGSRDEWLNCASLLDDARGAQKFCRPLIVGTAVETARPGDWLMTEDHISMIVRPAQTWTVEGKIHSTADLVVDCSPRHGYDASIQFGGSWSSRCQVIRPLVYR